MRRRPDGTLGLVGYAHWLAGQVLDVARVNRFWMTWNLILAFIPAGLAVVLFWRPHVRTVMWWFGVGCFALFLPNAPYVLTDLIHLRWDAARSASDGVLVFGVLPLYGLFVTLGMTSYVFCVALIVREVRTVRTSVARWQVELPVHALCSLGIVLGRITRLNSWDTITQPRGTLESIFATLTWRGAPFAFAAVFIAVFASYTVFRALLVAGASWGGGWARRLGWVDGAGGGHGPGDATTPASATPF